jgi:hypothetical protein
MVIKYMKENTTYQCINFKEVAVSVACSLRKEDPFAASEHSTFSWEVIHAYHHFAFGDKEFQSTACPRKTA